MGAFLGLALGLGAGYLLASVLRSVYFPGGATPGYAVALGWAWLLAEQPWAGPWGGWRWDLATLWLQYISLAAYTIWARGVGPRFRPDQLSDLTWRELLLLCGACLIAALAGLL